MGAKFERRGLSLEVLRIDGAQFQGADLSQVDAAVLANWTFQRPPVYDDRTRFPAGFDPAARRWTRRRKG